MTNSGTMTADLDQRVHHFWHRMRIYNFFYILRNYSINKCLIFLITSAITSAILYAT